MSNLYATLLLKMCSNILISYFLLFFVSSLNAQNNSIKEDEFIQIGGIEQRVTINGNDKTKPVILFIHGGPGSVLSPYSENIFGSGKNDFVLVNWDQRGAGRTFGKNAPDKIDENYWVQNPLTLNQMVEDGIELSKYLINHM